MSGSVPWLLNISRVSGMVTIAAILVDSFSTMAAGVPAGARTPCHVFTSTSGSPASAKVGTWGGEDNRDSAVTAIALSLPLLM